MHIIWHGQSCFEIIASQKAGEQVKIVIDPFTEETGLSLPKLDAEILLITHDHYDHNNIKEVAGSPFLIQGPVEYERKDIFPKINRNREYPLGIDDNFRRYNYLTQMRGLSIGSFKSYSIRSRKKLKKNESERKCCDFLSKISFEKIEKSKNSEILQ